LGLPVGEADWVEHFGRFEPLSENLAAPLAQRYHGHQFRHYNHELGDGRGFLFAQLFDREGRLLDLGTKGSGQTPYSRRGDGRLTLLGGVREVLATRYLEHLGMNTSRTLSLIETGEELVRGDEPSPTRSAVMVRLNHSHIRFGTFQRLAFFENKEAMERLISYCLKYFYPDAKGGADLLEQVCIASADMVAGWMVAGFVHGVMNTDNMNITGESFDYGPYRFLPTMKPNLTAAYFDHNGLYRFARQPEIMYWNLAQLAQSLSIVIDDQALLKALEAFAPAYQTALRNHAFRSLGLRPKELKTDTEFVLSTFKILEDTQVSWPQFWHDWCGGSPKDITQYGEAFSDWKQLYAGYDTVSEKPEGEAASLIYEEIGALWQPIAEQDDWSDFEAKLSSFERAI
jgi:uncharacterized protein YdiU (UPF0061 family)